MPYNLPSYEAQQEILARVANTNDKVIQGEVGKVLKTMVFTTNGTFKVPEKVTQVFLTGCGGGGGGGAAETATASNGSSGGITSFGALLSISGGGGGKADRTANNIPGGAAGGLGGQAGESSGIYKVTLPSSVSTMTRFHAGKGGNCGPFHGGYGIYNSIDINGITANGGYGSGGGGIAWGNDLNFASGGGGAHFVNKQAVDVIPLADIPVTIGNGGVGGKFSGNYKAGNGGNGILIVEWWE